MARSCAGVGETEEMEERREIPPPIPIESFGNTATGCMGFGCAENAGEEVAVAGAEDNADAFLKKENFEAILDGALCAGAGCGKDGSVGMPFPNSDGIDARTVGAIIGETDGATNAGAGKSFGVMAGIGEGAGMGITCVVDGDIIGCPAGTEFCIGDGKVATDGIGAIGSEGV